MGMAFVDMVHAGSVRKEREVADLVAAEREDRAAAVMELLEVHCSQESVCVGSLISLGHLAYCVSMAPALVVFPLSAGP